MISTRYCSKVFVLKRSPDFFLLFHKLKKGYYSLRMTINFLLLYEKTVVIYCSRFKLVYNLTVDAWILNTLLFIHLLIICSIYLIRKSASLALSKPWLMKIKNNYLLGYVIIVSNIPKISSTNNDYQLKSNLKINKGTKHTNAIKKTRKSQPQPHDTIRRYDKRYAKKPYPCCVICRMPMVCPRIASFVEML